MLKGSFKYFVFFLTIMLFSQVYAEEIKYRPILLAQNNPDRLYETNCLENKYKNRLEECNYSNRFTLHPYNGTIKKDAFRGTPLGLELRKTCVEAWKSIESSPTIKCLIGIEKSLHGVFLDVNKFLQDYSDCKEFTEEFASKMTTLLNTGVEPPFDRKRCLNYASILEERGINSITSTCIKFGGGTFESISECAGGSAGTQKFKDVWISSMKECAEGKRLNIVPVLRRVYEQIDSKDFNPNISCNDVFRIVSKLGFIDSDLFQKFNMKEAEGLSRRLPRDDEIYSAFEAGVSEQMGCRPLYFMKPCVFVFKRPKELDDFQIAAKQYNNSANEFLQKQNIPSSIAINIVPEGILKITSFELLECKAIKELLYECKINVKTDCNVSGIGGMNGIDIGSKAITIRVCTKMIPKSTEQFTVVSGKITMINKPFSIGTLVWGYE